MGHTDRQTNRQTVSARHERAVLPFILIPCNLTVCFGVGSLYKQFFQECSLTACPMDLFPAISKRLPVYKTDFQCIPCYSHPATPKTSVATRCQSCALRVRLLPLYSHTHPVTPVPQYEDTRLLDVTSVGLSIKVPGYINTQGRAALCDKKNGIQRHSVGDGYMQDLRVDSLLPHRHGQHLLQKGFRQPGDGLAGRTTICHFQISILTKVDF